MKLYHSSPKSISKPDISFSRDYLDFGKGFYLTSLYEQAVKYAQRFIRRGQEAWLNSFELDFEDFEWKVLKFESYDKTWLEFVSKCRAGSDNSDYDIVIGGIANDKVFQTLDRYFEGEITAEEAIELLKYERPNIQYCIRSQKMLDERLKHIESKKL